jgi:hypothetical protein
MSYRAPRGVRVVGRSTVEDANDALAASGLNQHPIGRIQQFRIGHVSKRGMAVSYHILVDGPRLIEPTDTGAHVRGIGGKRFVNEAGHLMSLRSS